VIVIILSLGLLAFGIYGVLNLEQEYDEMKMIPNGNSLKEYLNAYQRLYTQPSMDSGYIYIGEPLTSHTASAASDHHNKYNRGPKITPQ